MEQRIIVSTTYGILGKALAAVAVGMSLLLGANAESAETVIFGDASRPTKATAILDLDVSGTSYDVEFVYAQPAIAEAVYGALPGDYDFDTSSSAEAAAEAVVVALTAAGALFVGDETSTVNFGPLSENFFIGFEQGRDLGPAKTVDAWAGTIPDVSWFASPDNVIASDARTWALFVPAEGTGNEPPVADANGPYNGTTGVAVNFDGSASIDPDGSISSYEWDFGDTNVGSGATPSHTYATADVYNVTLRVTDNEGKTDSAGTTANIGQANQPPLADANGPYLGVAGVAVTFDGSASSDTDGSVASWSWDFGDGSPAGTGVAPSHTYSTSDVYNVTLTVTDDLGETDTDSTAAVIGVANEPPVADANGPYTGQAGVAVTFDGSASNDTDGTIQQYDWDFGDTTIETDAGPMPSHTYNSTGNYIVSLTVTDDDGDTDTNDTTAAIGVGNQPPVADANGPYTGSAGVAVNFDGSASTDTDGTIVSWSWDFGDESPAGTDPTPSHVYTLEGRYNVTLTVTDSAGGTDSSGTAAVISAEPPQTTIVSASLPSSRSVQVGNLASAFATIINTRNIQASDCFIGPGTPVVAADFAYQTTDAANAPIGTPNTPVDIDPNGFQNFVFGFTPAAPLDPTEILLTYECANSAPAPLSVGLNTLLLSATTTASADIVALAITPTGDGTLNLPGTNGSNAFSVATVNNGGTDTITAVPRQSTADLPLPLVFSICETNPGTGVCLAAPAPSTTSTVNANATPTYSVFVTATGNVPFDPSNNRIIVEFRDSGGAVRGSTSVAVRTQ